MTKKDYILIADALRPVVCDASPGGGKMDSTMENVIDRLCEAFRGDNWAFKSHVFRGYLAGTCGPAGGKVK